MSKHKGLPCQHTVNKGHNHATLFLLFFFAYAHAKRVRQVSCERVRTVPCACDHLIHCFPVEGHIYKTIDVTAKVVNKENNKQPIVSKGKQLMKTECVTADHTNTNALTLWEDLIDAVDCGKTYKFKNVKI